MGRSGHARAGAGAPASRPAARATRPWPPPPAPPRRAAGAAGSGARRPRAARSRARTPRAPPPRRPSAAATATAGCTCARPAPVPQPPRSKCGPRAPRHAALDNGACCTHDMLAAGSQVFPRRPGHAAVRCPLYLQRPARCGLTARRQGWAWAGGAHSVKRLESLGGSASTVASTRTRQRSAAQRTAGAASPAGISDCGAARAR